MKKKLLAILLATSMVIGLAACGSGSNTGSSGSSEESSVVEDTGADDTATDETDTVSEEAAITIDPNDPWAGWSDIDTSEHVVITYMTVGDTPSGDSLDTMNAMLDELNAILTEKVNAEIQMYYISWTDFLSNYNLTLARMDGSVDLVGTASDWLDAWPNAKNGAFLELSEDMLATYAPATYTQVSEDNHWDLCKYNGEIYMIPEDNYAQWTNHGFAYRLDWAHDAGMEDGVNSWEDLTEDFRYIREAYPDMIPWDTDGAGYGTLATGWISSHSDYVPIDGLVSGAIWGCSKDDPYTVYSPHMSETDMLVDFAETMKEWDTLGVWPTDVLNNRVSTNKDDFRVGRVAVEQHHTTTWTDLVSHTAQNTIYQDDPDADVGFFWFGEETQNLVRLSITHGAMAISAASANPERALMVYDLIRNDPDCYRLFCYGQEGVSWEMTDDGMRTTPEGYNPDTQNINGMTNFWWGRNDDLEIRDVNLNWDEIDALYNEYDQVAIDYPYGQFVADTDNIQTQINNITEIHGNYMKQIAYGKYNGTAEEIVAEYQAALEAAGINDVTAELQRQFDELYGTN